jgi:hypothetical protein
MQQNRRDLLLPSVGRRFLRELDPVSCLGIDGPRPGCRATRSQRRQQPLLRRGSRAKARLTPAPSPCMVAWQTSTHSSQMKMPLGPTIGGTGPAWAVVALQFSALSTGTPGFDASAGWSFTTNEKISVTALDAFDPNGDGAAGTVRLYNASGTVLASAKVTTTDPKEGSPIMFFSAKLSKPLVLAAMTTYFIAEDLGTATTANGNVSGLTTSSAIKYDGEVAAMGQGKNPTTDATGGMFSPGIFGPNFDVTLGASAVPEPSTWAMMLIGFGLLGLGGAFSRPGGNHPIGLDNTA